MGCASAADEFSIIIPMKPCVLAFSGQIASGKTTIAKSASKVLEWKYASFGDFVRAEAVLRGKNPESREDLQETGNKLIGHGWELFCKAVLECANWKPGEGLVIDGIRHVEGLQVIREIVAPLNIYLIYIAVDEEIRNRRLASKNIQQEKLLQIEHHDTETQVPNTLLSLADTVLDGGGATDSAVVYLRNWLEIKQKDQVNSS
jgi:dephospho-CoA kinase